MLEKDILERPPLILSAEQADAFLSELEEGEEGKRYRAEDFEGHRWMFIQK